jgi:hypothetical protein
MHYSEQKRTIEADSAIRDVILQIRLEAAMRKGWPGQLIFTKQKEKYGRCNAYPCEGPGESGGFERCRFSDQGNVR